MDGVTVFTVEAIHLALYLQHIGNSTGSRASVEEAVYALSWIHKAAGLPSPINDPFVQTVLGGFVGCWHHPLLRSNQLLVRC